MTVVDLHPEDLLDKDARGELLEGERLRLEAHLARCAACRAERVLRLDFIAELESDDRPSAILGLVAGALKAEADAAAKADLEPLAVPGLRRRTRRTTVTLLFAAALLVASVAAGATGITDRVWSQLRSPAQDVTHLEPATVVPTSTTLSTGDQTRQPLPTVTSDEPAPSPIAARVEPSAIRTVSFTPSSASGAAPSVAPSALVGLAGLASSSAMFDAANAARRAGDTAGALALYDDLERQYPTSREAHSAMAMTGRLLLDKGDAAGAVTRFDGYLASGAPELREEAMAGRAVALERLGRDEDESRAWALLLATYPHTPYASHARARVGRSLPQ